MPQCLHGRRKRLAALLPLILVMAACQSATENGDSRTCQQTFEFGNTGCFEVAGQVVGARGQVLPGISVGLRPVVGPNVVFSSTYQMTDTMGQFRIRLSRMLGGPPPDARPDTLSVFVFALNRGSGGGGVPVGVVDSVLTLVTVAPVGVVPVAAAARIVLPMP